MKKFLKNEVAQDLVEYTLLIAFIALASVAIYSVASSSINKIWQNTVVDKKTLAKATVPTEKLVVHEVKKVTLGHWKDFGIIGNIYRKEEMPAGTFDGLEDGLMVFKTLNGPIWFADFEPNDNHDPLDTRKVYLVHISGNLAKGCGYAMRDFTTAPPQCVMEEKITTWQGAENFLQSKVSPDPKQWAEIETFLRNREWK